MENHVSAADGQPAHDRRGNGEINLADVHKARKSRRISSRLYLFVFLVIEFKKQLIELIANFQPVVSTAFFPIRLSSTYLRRLRCIVDSAMHTDCTHGMANVTAPNNDIWSRGLLNNF